MIFMLSVVAFAMLLPPGVIAYCIWENWPTTPIPSEKAKNEHPVRKAKKSSR